ncbi:C-terminal binding protein [Anaerosporobacter sp.]
MKILISDYEEELNRNISYEIALLKEHLPDAKIEVYPYLSEEDFLEKIEDVDALSMAFIPITKKVFERAKKLRCISVNATGYGTIDMEEAKKHNVIVLTVKDYCTKEVAEHTMALMLALVRNLKVYSLAIEKNHVWSYQSANEMERLSYKTLAIFGFGRIGQAVAKRAKAFDMEVLAVDPYVDESVAKSMGVRLVSKEYALENSDIITNHMNQTESNGRYFGEGEYKKMKKRPIFLNLGRGACVDEKALVSALDLGYIRAAGIDVLTEENPGLVDNPLLGRDNVIITPHAAFFSKQSMEDLQRITCKNIIKEFR